MAQDFHKIYYIEGSPEEIWTAFLTEKEIEDWLATGESRVDGREGGEFRWHLNGENMEGKFTKLVMPYKKLHFKWKRDQWNDRKFAKVQIDINEMSDRTRMEIWVTKIPNTEWDEVYEIWNGTIIPKLEKYLG